jgi:hypothetical protein
MLNTARRQLRGGLHLAMVEMMTLGPNPGERARTLARYGARAWTIGCSGAILSGGEEGWRTGGGGWEEIGKGGCNIRRLVIGSG